MPAALILAPAGPRLTPWETAFFRDTDPWGFIVFARNVETPDQLRALTDALRDTVGRNAPVLIDQEGGRVQRMRAPHWREYLPALDQMARATDPIRAQWLRNRLIAAELSDVGIDVNCAPLADLVEPQTHPILRNRLYGDSPEGVIEAARTCAEAHLAGGVLPVLKHLPGYGRASVDSHLALPRISEDLESLVARDFSPFAALSDIAMGMTAHIVVEAIDATAPATTSVRTMRYIRDEIGFSGLIMTDDISMEALSGSVDQRARASLEAGCDIVLHCNGQRGDMERVVRGVGDMTPAATDRAERALAQRKTPSPIDIQACAAELEALLA